MKDVAAVDLYIAIAGKLSATEVANALLSFDQEYSRFMVDYTLKNYGVRLSNEALELYITECKIESVFARFIPAWDSIKTYVHKYEPLKAAVEFLENTSQVINRFAALAETHEHHNFEISKAQTQTFETLLSNAPKMAAEGLVLTALEVSETGIFKRVVRKATFSPNTAQLALQATREHLEWANSRKAEKFDDVILYLEQANKHKAKAYGRTIDRAIVSQISPEPLPIYFPSEMDGEKMKRDIVLGNNNPFAVGFRVDVTIDYDQSGNPRSYTVMNLREVIRHNDPQPGSN